MCLVLSDTLVIYTSTTYCAASSMEPDSKKRKYEDENRTFKQEWEHNFAFVSHNGKPLCLICNATLSQYKGSNLSRHYETNHKNFSRDFPPNSELRKNKLSSLKARLQGQQTVMASFNKQAELAAEASFAISWNVARAKRPYSDGEFLRKNISDVVAILDPGNAKLQRQIMQIPISRHTIERRISLIGDDIATQLHSDLTNAVAFSLALDESTDISDTPQVAITVRYILPDATIKEEMLNLVALRETTRATDIKCALDSAVTKAGIPLRNLVSVSTDGAPAMIGKNNGLIALLKRDSNYTDFVAVHCVIHREHLATKFAKYEHVLKKVLEIVNFIRTNAKTHRQFKNFIEELELEDKPDDVSFYCIVRWLSASNVLNRFVELIAPITEFLAEKGKSCLQLEDEEWMQDLMFFADVMNHLRILNLSLQGKDKIISDLAQAIFSFLNKLKLFQRDLRLKQFSHFPHLKRRTQENNANVEDCKIEEYADKLQGLLEELETRFKDLQDLRPCFRFLVNPFTADVINVGCPIPSPLVADRAAVELELLELQEDEALKSVHQSASTVDFWKHVPQTKYPATKKTAMRLLSMFGTTYSCESLFSVMKFIKSKHRAVLTNEHLVELLRTALTTYQPNFKKLVTRMEVHKAPKTVN